MFSKGMVSKSKYCISEKNKGIPVSICPQFYGYFSELTLTCLNPGNPTKINADTDVLYEGVFFRVVS